MKSSANKKLKDNPRIKKLLSIFNIKKFPMDLGRFVTLFFIIVFRIKRIPAEKNVNTFKLRGGAVVCANHSTFFDPNIIAALYPQRRMHYLAANDTMKNPILRVLMRGMGCIEINREIFDVECIKKCIELLKHGYIINVFAQGHLVLSGEIEALKSGAILMAARTNTPIVPVYILKRAHWYNRYIIAVGAAFYCRDYCNSTMPLPKDIERINEILFEKSKACKDAAEKYFNERKNKK